MTVSDQIPPSPGVPGGLHPTADRPDPAGTGSDRIGADPSDPSDPSDPYNPSDRTLARTTRAVRVLLTVGTIAIAAPIVVAGIALARRNWLPTGDMAQAELRLRGFWAHPPLVGAAGRLGTLSEQGAHPGPSAYWAQWPIYALGGRTVASMVISVVVVHLVWLAALVRVTLRRGGPALAAAMVLAMAVLVRGFGPEVFTEPWNPWFAIIPFAFFVVMIWSVLALGGTPNGIGTGGIGAGGIGTGERAGRLDLAWAAVAGSYAVQAHIGYAPLVAVLGAVATLAVLIRLRRSDTRGPALRSLAWAALAGALMWSLPLYQQLTGTPANLAVVVRSFTAATEAPLGPRTALRIVGGQLNLFGPWLRAPVAPLDEAILPGTLVLLVLWATAAVVSWRGRRDVVLGRLAAFHGVLGLGVVVGVFAISRVHGEVLDYIFKWMPVLTGLAVAATVATGITVYSGTGTVGRHARVPDARTMIAPVAACVAVAVVISAVAVPSFSDVKESGPNQGVTVARLEPQLRATLGTEQTYIIRWSDSWTLGGIGFGEVLALERDGYHVGTDASHTVPVMPHRVIAADRADAAIWFVTGSGIARWKAKADARLIAEADPLSPEERARAVAISARVRTRLAQIGGPELAAKLDDGLWNVLLDDTYRANPPADVAADIVTLGKLGEPTAVFLTDPGVLAP